LAKLIIDGEHAEHEVVDTAGINNFWPWQLSTTAKYGQKQRKESQDSRSNQGEVPIFLGPKPLLTSSTRGSKNQSDHPSRFRTAQQNKTRDTFSVYSPYKMTLIAGIAWETIQKIKSIWSSL